MTAPEPSLTDWRALACDLAAALGAMPCTCRQPHLAWPMLKVGLTTADAHGPYECRRCRVLALYKAAMQATAALPTTDEVGVIAPAAQ